MNYFAAMNTHYLAPLFTPESIALFGASDRTDSVGGIVFRNLLSSGYQGQIYAINPRRAEVQGEKAFAFVANQNGGFEKREIQIGLSDGITAENLSGLTIKDRIKVLQ